MNCRVILSYIPLVDTTIILYVVPPFPLDSTCFDFTLLHSTWFHLIPLHCTSPDNISFPLHSKSFQLHPTSFHVASFHLIPCCFIPPDSVPLHSTFIPLSFHSMLLSFHFHSTFIPLHPPPIPLDFNSFNFSLIHTFSFLFNNSIHFQCNPHSHERARRGLRPATCTHIIPCRRYRQP